MASDIDLAAVIARAEVLERLHALYDVAKDTLIDGRFFPAMSWPDLKSDGLIEAGNCILGAHPFGPPPYLDATGLAYHRDISSAARHAVYEVLERHFAAAVWYDEEPVMEHGLPIRIYEDYACRFFILANRPSLPFIIAVITGSGPFTGAGSCFGPTLGSARTHALKEASMLLDGFIEKDNGVCASSAARVMSLRDPDMGRARISHFEQRVTATTPWILETEHAAIDDGIIVDYLKDRERLQIALIGTSTGGFIVRAVIKDLPDLSSSRRMSTGIPTDWFC